MGAAKKTKAARKGAGAKEAKARATASGAGKTPGVVVDKALKARWEEALARYHQARVEETEGWDARYEALGDILESDPPYFLAGGYKSAAAFLKAEVPDQDERTVRMHVRVARYFDPQDEAQFGVAKLDLLLRYLQAAGGVPLAPTKIATDRQKVRVAEGKEFRNVPFSEATAEDLRRAARAEAGAKGKTASSRPPAAKALHAALSKAKLGSVGVRVRGGRVDLTGIEWGHLAALGKALAAAKLGDTPPSK